MQTLLLLLKLLLESAGLITLSLVLVSEVQYIKTTLVHQATHNRLLRNRKLARRLADLLGATVLAPNVQEYERVHIGQHHRSEMVASVKDEDTQFVMKLGFLPGLEVEAYWRQFKRTLLNPRVHLRLFMARIRANLMTGPMERRVFAWLWWSGLLSIACAHGLLLPVLLAYVWPISLPFQVAQILQALTEHMHFVNPGEERNVEWHARVSHARFVGEAAPTATGLAGVKAWTGFWLRLVFLHLPLRMAVLPGDLANHSAHHWKAGKADWTQAPYSYRDLKAEVPVEWHREFWGLRATLQAVFEGMSKAPR